MQVDVGEDGAGNAPLRGPDERAPRLLPPQVARPECFPDQADEAVVRDPLTEQGDQDVVIDLVERSRILIPLLKTQLLELASPEPLEQGNCLRSVREQVEVRVSMSGHLDRAIVNPVIDPVWRDRQLAGDLRHGQVARNATRMGLAAHAEQAMT